MTAPQLEGTPRDSYWTVNKDTRHETRIKRCGVCGVTQAREPGKRFGKCPYTYLHGNAAAPSRPVEREEDRNG